MSPETQDSATRRSRTELEQALFAVGIAGYAAIALENGRVYDAACRATRGA